MQKNLTFYLIARIREKANNFIQNSLIEYGLKELAPSHGDILFALFKHESLTMKEITEVIDRDKSTVTGLIVKLEKLGLVTKIPDKKDRRTIYIRLTSKGQQLKPTLIAISDELIEKLNNGLNFEEQLQLEKLLNKVNSHWQ